MKQIAGSVLLGIVLVSPSALADESCVLAKNVGLAESDAAAVTEVVCQPIRSDLATYPGNYGVRVVKVGSRIVLTLVAHLPTGETTEKEVILTSIEEVTVAAPRLREALVDAKHVDETANVTNIVGDETRLPKTRPASIHAWMGMIGAGHEHGVGGGVLLGIAAGSERWSFVGDLRVAGESFNKVSSLAAAIFTLGSIKIGPEASFDYVSLSGGTRHHFSTKDVAPFVGGGLALDAIGRGTGAARYRSEYGYSYPLPSKTTAGLAGYAEVGVDVLRTHRVGGALVIRGDVPAFAVEHRRPGSDAPNDILTTRSYLPVVSAGIAMRF